MNFKSNPTNPYFNNGSIHFSGRAKIVRDADKLCRAVNSRFPHVSPTYRMREIASNILNLIDDTTASPKNIPLSAREKFEKYESLIKSYVVAHNKLESNRNKRIVNRDMIDYFSKLIVNLRRDHIANCAELSEVAFLMCKNKNFDNVRIFSLEAVDKTSTKALSSVDLDHVAVSFKHGDKTVVVDPWLGIADFAENYKTKIKTLYKNFFIDLKNSDSLKFQYYDDEYNNLDQNVLNVLVNKFKSLNVNL